MFEVWAEQQNLFAMFLKEASPLCILTSHSFLKLSFLGNASKDKSGRLSLRKLHFAAAQHLCHLFHYRMPRAFKLRFRAAFNILLNQCIKC